jgi:predicted dehydrogenase
LVTPGNVLRVGLIGAGLQGKRHAAAMKQSAETELVVVVDVNDNAAQALAREMGCEVAHDWTMVVARDDINAVVVCTPPNLHAPISIAASRNGKHVLCEKSLARNPDEAAEMVSAASENDVMLMCGFNLRHHPGIRQARKWVDEGVIEELSFIRCRYGIGGRPGYDKESRADPEIAGGGQLMDQGMHIIDLSRWFLGEFTEATGFLSTSFWDVAPLEDNAFVLLRTASGQIASFHVSWAQWKNLFSFEVFGTDGYITVEGLGGSYGIERAVVGKREFLKPFREEIIEFRGEDLSLFDQWQEFVAAVREKREPVASGNDGLQAIKIAYAIYESARSGRVVKFRA